MLNLNWALAQHLLDASDDVTLVAYAADPDLDGKLHVDGCWELAEHQADEETSEGPQGPTGRVRLYLGWAHVQALLDAEAAGGAGSGTLCSCLTEPSLQLPGPVRLAHALGELRALLDELAADPGGDAPAGHTRLLVAVAAVLTEPHTPERVRNEPLLAALDQLLAEAAPVLAQIGTPDHQSSSRDDGRWREARDLSTISARAVNAAYLDLPGRRLLVRASAAAVRSTLLDRQPVLSDDPDVDPATL